MLNNILIAAACIVGAATLVLAVGLYLLVQYLGDFDDPNW